MDATRNSTDPVTKVIAVRFMYWRMRRSRAWMICSTLMTAPQTNSRLPTMKHTAPEVNIPTDDRKKMLPTANNTLPAT